MNVKDSGTLERKMRIVLRSGHVVSIEVSVVSTFVIGPGPRPKRDESLLIIRADEEHVLVVEVGIEMMDRKPADGESGDIEKRIEIRLEGNLRASIGVSIASTIILGIGPKPRRKESLLARRIDETQLLVVGAEVTQLEAASIQLGSSSPVGGG